MAPGGEMRVAQGIFVNGEFFDVLGIRPAAGRLLDASDDREGCGSPPAVISHGFWQREFGGHPVVGRTITLESRPFEIVGITPPGFFGVEVGRAFDVAVPLCAEALTNPEDSAIGRRHYWWIAAMGRLKPGWTQEQAAAHLRAISPGLFEATLPSVYTAVDRKDYLGLRLTAERGAAGVSALRMQYETPLLLLLGITGLVLLIACGNLANLMLARATTREREIAVRLAIGASRARIVRQLLTESVVLASIGAAAGALLARWLSGTLVALIRTERVPVFLDLAPDWRVLAFTAGVAAATCLLFGLAPALRATRTVPAEALRSNGRGSTADRGRLGLRQALVVVQVAFTLVLLFGALLFGRSLQNLATVDTGMESEGVVIADINLPNDDPAQRPALLRELLDRVRATRGVEAACYVRIIPLSGSGSNNMMTAEGVASQPEDRIANMNYVSDGCFATLGIPLLAGRDLDARDTPGSPRVAVVNQSFARRFFGDADPIGRTFREAAEAGRPEPVYRIVGLVGNTKYRLLREDDEPIAWVAATQEARPGYPAFLARSADAGTAIEALRRTFHDVHPSIVIQFGVLDQRIGEQMVRDRLMAVLSAGFGLLAAILSMVGVYGVMSYVVSRRRNEIGVRMALGASRRDVSGMILKEVGGVLAVGMAAGAVLALVAARGAQSLLFALQPSDPATLAASAALLGGIGLLAGYLPARRAARIEPLTALREE
jgi:predicted permease